MERRQHADDAAAAVLSTLLRATEANLEGAIAGTDSECLHDLRVSVRRARCVQRELRRVFPQRELTQFRHEFRWLQQVTGEARDLDVYVLEFDQMRAFVPEDVRSGLDPLLAVLEARRRGAREEMARALRSERTASLLREWSGFLGRIDGLPADDRPDAARPITEVAGRRIARVYWRTVKMGDAIHERSPAADLHELRKKGKELRYLLELFAVPLYPSRVVQPMIKALKGVQNVLGRHQDREIQVAMLRSMKAEVSASDGDASTLAAMQTLAERLEDDKRATRAEFTPRFKSFASERQRKLVKGTFA